MVNNGTLYKSATSIAEDYFGPAAGRFMQRLIASHLDKEPEKLTAKDMAGLAKWAKLTASMMTDDQAAVNEFARRLKSLK